MDVFDKLENVLNTFMIIYQNLLMHVIMNGNRVWAVRSGHAAQLFILKLSVAQKLAGFSHHFVIRNIIKYCQILK